MVHAASRTARLGAQWMRLVPAVGILSTKTDMVGNGKSSKMKKSGSNLDSYTHNGNGTLQRSLSSLSSCVSNRSELLFRWALVTKCLVTELPTVDESSFAEESRPVKNTPSDN
eukprot:scaffold132930_cov27-Attheya_sp.AAC.1